MGRIRSSRDKRGLPTGLRISTPSTKQIAGSVALLVLAFVAGCGTTRWTDTERTATELLLISDSIDQAVARIDFAVLRGCSVYLDTQYLDQTVGQEYLASSVRQRILSAGCRLAPDPDEADYVVELRSGGIGTNRNDSLIFGTPETAVPIGLTGQLTKVPEIPLVKGTEQIASAKVGVFAYERRTGRPVWKSGLVQSTSTVDRQWIFGGGPFERGRTALRPPHPWDRLRRLLTPWRDEPLPRNLYRANPLWREAVFADPPALSPPHPPPSRPRPDAAPLQDGPALHGPNGRRPGEEPQPPEAKNDRRTPPVYWRPASPR